MRFDPLRALGIGSNPEKQEIVGGETMPVAAKRTWSRRHLLASVAALPILARTGSLTADGRSISGKLPWSAFAGDPPRPVDPLGWFFFNAAEAAMVAIVTRPERFDMDSSVLPAFTIDGIPRRGPAVRDLVFGVPRRVRAVPRPPGPGPAASPARRGAG